jgi:hypothetical protein
MPQSHLLPTTVKNNNSCRPRLAQCIPQVSYVGVSPCERRSFDEAIREGRKDRCQCEVPEERNPAREGEAVALQLSWYAVRPPNVLVRPWLARRGRPRMMFGNTDEDI